MSEPDDKQIERLLQSIPASGVPDYPRYRRGLGCGGIAALVGFLPVWGALTLFGKGELWYMALIPGGVLAVITAVMVAFRPGR